VDHTDIYRRLPAALLPWYEANKRQLPWREDTDPYHIWISEIMLQQTRVEAVKGYYTRFLQALPTVEALANADDNQLEKLWEGLGYYTRMRNMKKAARWIVDDFGGIFPREYAKILALPGIGPYTAGAIGSIAFGLPTPAVDGNVLRLIARLTDDPTPVQSPAFRKQAEDALRDVYPAESGMFTQALMELGATLCGPNRAPECGQCPCRDFCLGHRNGTAAKLPVKIGKKPRRKEQMTVFILSCADAIALEKRPDSGVLANMWQLPNVAGKLELGDALAEVERIGLKPREIVKIVEKKHIFTHIEWDMRGVYVEIAEQSGSFTWLTAQQRDEQAGLPTAFRQFLENL